MNETDANTLAKVIGGEPWASGGGIWLVRLTNTDGKFVVFSDDMVCEYRDEEAFRQGDASQSIVLVLSAFRVVAGGKP